MPSRAAHLDATRCTAFDVFNDDRRASGLCKPLPLRQPQQQRQEFVANRRGVVLEAFPLASSRYATRSTTPSSPRCAGYPWKPNSACVQRP